MKYFSICILAITWVCCSPNPSKQTKISSSSVVDSVSAQTITPADKKNSTRVIPASDSIIVSGKALYHGNYCGGAAPPPDMVEEILRPKPFSGQLYFERQGHRIKVKTGKEGNFNCRLIPGHYRVYLAQNKIGHEEYWYNETADGKWWAKQVFATFTAAENKPIRFTLDFICAPSDRNRP